MKPLNELSATEAAAGIAAGKIKSVDLVEACLAHIAARESTVKAWAHLDPAYARAQAKACDAQSPRGPLHGVPVAIKDIIDTADLPTEYGSPIYAGHRPTADASCVALVRRAGGIVMGKTVTTEFAAFYPGKTANPHNPKHTPGGSSSGSAAAVGDFHVPVGFGTQTAGSITRPSAYCGAVGFKPTYGTYAIEGVKAEAHSFDTLGTISRTVDDAYLMWRVLQSGDAPLPPAPTRPRIGLFRPLQSLTAPEARDALDLAGRKLSGAGCTVEEISLPWFEPLLETHKLMLDYEAARNFVCDAVSPRREKLSPPMQEMIERGLRCPPPAYLEARAQMARGQKAFDEAIGRFDAIMAPSAPGEAPAGLAATGDPIHNRVWTLLHPPLFNLTVSRGPNGLPVGVQFIGKRDGDLALLSLGRMLTEALA